MKPLRLFLAAAILGLLPSALCHAVSWPADTISVDHSASNYTPAGATVEDHLAAMDAAMATLGEDNYANSTTTDPTINDDVDNYSVGDFWLNTTSGDVFACTDNTDGAAVWANVTAAASVTLAASDTEDGSKAAVSNDKRLKAYPSSANREAGGPAMTSDRGLTSADESHLFLDPSGGDGDHTITVSSGDYFVIVHDGASGIIRAEGAILNAKGQVATIAYDGTEYHGWGPATEVYAAAVTDATTTITTGTAKLTFRMPYALYVTEVRASLTTVSSSGVVTVDINESGTTILSTKLTIDASEKTSQTAAAAAVISDTSLADDAEITVDIDTAGTGAVGLKLAIYGVRAL